MNKRNIRRHRLEINETKENKKYFYIKIYQASFHSRTKRETNLRLRSSHLLLTCVFIKVNTMCDVYYFIAKFLQTPEFTSVF